MHVKWLSIKLQSYPTYVVLFLIYMYHDAIKSGLSKDKDLHENPDVSWKLQKWKWVSR